MYDQQGHFLGKVVSVTKDDAGEIVSVQLRAAVTREARVPARCASWRGAASNWQAPVSRGPDPGPQ